MNAYEFLGIDRGADLDAIKRAYRTLAKQLHPDVNAGDEQAADRFKEITAAYNMLADNRKRAEYDGNRMGATKIVPAPNPGRKTAPGTILKSMKAVANGSWIFLATWPGPVSAG